MDTYLYNSIKTRNWYGTIYLRNSIVKKYMISNIDNDVKNMMYFLNSYVIKFNDNIDIAFFASYKMNEYQLLTLCRHLYNMHGYLVFSSWCRYRRFLRIINKITLKTYEQNLYYLLCYYINVLLLCITLFFFLMTCYTVVI